MLLREFLKKEFFFQNLFMIPKPSEWLDRKTSLSDRPHAASRIDTALTQKLFFLLNLPLPGFLISR